MFDVKKFLHSDALGPAVEWKGYPKFFEELSLGSAVILAYTCMWFVLCSLK